MNLILIVILSGITIGFFITVFKYKRLIKELKQAKKELEESETILKIKVQARTRELRELAEQREEIIKERTKELQKKIEELERFQRLTVGRELKMIELKEEIEKLKEELEKTKPR